MPKDYFQGINPPGSGSRPRVENGPERTIRNIPLAQRRERGVVHPAENNTPPPPGRNASSHMGGGYKRNRMFIWGVAGLALAAALLFVGLSMFKSTSVVITPRTQPVVMTEDISLTAYPMDSEQATLGALAYEVLEATYEAETSVPASGFSEVEEYASGLITVYNEHSATPVRLIKNTRFETPDGLVFRIRDSITVPGKRDAGPGTITATVYADEPGAKYNISAVDRFTLPGLRGSDMFANVYARSTSAFRGGFIGSKPRVADADLKVAQAKLRSEIEARARAEVLTVSVPDKLVFPQLMMLSFESDTPTEGPDASAIIRERAVAKTLVFPAARFAQVIAAAVRAEVSESTVHLNDTSKIQIRSVSSDGAPAYGAEPVDLFVSGNSTLVFDVDTALLGNMLMGKTKSSFENVISAFPGIEKADAFIRPFWRGTFPSDAADIVFVINEV